MSFQKQNLPTLAILAAFRAKGGARLNKKIPALVGREIQLHDHEEEQSYSQYLVDCWMPDESHETRFEAERLQTLEPLLQAWKVADQAVFQEENKIRRALGFKSADAFLEDEEGKAEPKPEQMIKGWYKRCNIMNRAFFKERALVACRYLQSREDLYLAGEIRRKEHIGLLLKSLTKAEILVVNKSYRDRLGWTWKSCAALKNNILSLLENAGVTQVQRSKKGGQFIEGNPNNRLPLLSLAKLYSRTDFKDPTSPIVDFEFGKYNPDKTGIDWNADVRANLYGLDSAEDHEDHSDD